MNLSLYTVSAFIIIDTDGHRVLAKYYNSGESNANSKRLSSLKEQRAFEKGLFQKTKKAGGTRLPCSTVNRGTHPCIR